LGGADRPLVPVLVGPTGVGKTAVAVAWAALEPISVIGADARQVYRRLNIGTAKPEPAQLTRVPHLGIDLIDPGERYSAGRFARDASGWLARVRAEGREPVVVGGTGFYIRALAEGLFREPPLDYARRERLRAWAGLLGAAPLAHWAARLDRRFAGGGRQRAARAIEVALLTGRSLSWWQREARESGVMRPWYIHLTLPRDALQRRIAQRVDRMLDGGLIEEVRGVLADGVAPHAPGLDTVKWSRCCKVGSPSATCGMPSWPPRDATRSDRRRGFEINCAVRHQTSDVRQMKCGHSMRRSPLRDWLRPSQPGGVRFSLTSDV